MATVDECRDIVDELVAKLAAVDHDARKKNLPDRTLELMLLDLDYAFRGRIHNGDLVDIVEAEEPGPKPNIRLVMTSDDLVAMTNGELHFAHAWATGRVRLDASLRDLLRLRALL